MKGVILDADSLGRIDLAPISSLLDTWSIYPATSPDEIANRIFDADVVLSNKVALGKDILQESKRLKYIGIMATGTNNIDLNTARLMNIQVGNAVAYATPSVVQHTINFMLCLSTHMVDYLADVRKGRWQESHVFTRLDHSIVELAGKKLGIVGYGELGRNVANVARAFGMEILVARNTSLSDMPLQQLLAEVDYLSLHCPLTDETENMINIDTLKLMKPTAYLINTARGGLVNSEDLVEALSTGIIAGAAIDVLKVEPATTNEALINARQLENLLITPHNAWGAIESRQRLVIQMKENIEGFLLGQQVRQVM